MPLLPERVKALDSGVLVRQFSAVFLILWSAFIIMRIPLLSHLRRIGGDSLDSMLALAIEMHWLHVLNGTALEWRTTHYFFPIADTLGYNESFFLHGTFLALARFFGADFFLALQIVDWSFRAIGFLSMWALARRHFDWPNLVNLLAAALFVTANCYYPQATAHAQFLTCNLLPLLILLQIDSFRAVANGTFYRFVILAALFAGLMGALLVTSYYVSFFFILVDGTVLTLYVLLLRADSQLILPLPRLGRYAAAQLVLLVVFSIPFLLIYLPKAVETGMHPFSDVEPFALRPTDVINVGPYNLLWSHLYQRALGLLFPDWEGALYHQTGATPILFGLFLIGGWMLRRDRGSDWRQAMLFAMWCSNLLLLGVTIRWSRFWPWAWIYRFVPGSQGVRVIPLAQLNLMIPTIIVACNFIAVIWKLPQIRMALVLIALLLLIEQVNDYPIFNIDRSSENAFLAEVNHVPPSCRVFFAQNSRLGPDISTLYRHNVDAMILAEVSGTPTINGYATFLPPRWMLVHPEEAQYLSEIHEWLASHAVTGPVCAVDFKTGSWTILSD
jgi:hypothetical protein